MRLLPIGLLLAVAASAAPTRIADPEAFVADVYRRIAADTSGYAPPDDIYTPRLQALFEADRRRGGDEVGCIDFDFWTNSQDPSGIHDIRVTSRTARDPNRRTVIATFLLDGPKEIRFEFRRLSGKWRLDDVTSPKRERWTLSRLLRCKP